MLNLSCFTVVLTLLTLRYLHFIPKIEHIQYLFKSFMLTSKIIKPYFRKLCKVFIFFKKRHQNNLKNAFLNFLSVLLFEYFHFFDIISCRIYKNVLNNLFCKHCSWLEAPLLLDCFMPLITTRTIKVLKISFLYINKIGIQEAFLYT